MKNLNRIIKEELSGFLDSTEEDFEWAKDTKAEVPPMSERRRYSTVTFFSEIWGMSEENVKSLMEETWDYAPENDDPEDLPYGESFEYFVKEYILYQSKGKWEYIDEEVTSIDIWEGAHFTNRHVYKNKEDDSYWGFDYTFEYEEEEHSDELIEVFPWATKIVFK